MNIKFFFGELLTSSKLNLAFEEAESTPGPPGADGQEIELQSGVTHVQWRYVGAPAWTDLIALSAITGPAGQNGAPGADGQDGADGADGQEIELQSGVTHVQWRYVGAPAWTDLIALSAITGPAGQNGAPGADGQDGAVNYSLAATAQTSGTVPLLVASVFLPAGNYAAPSAAIGCANPSHAATCKLKKPDGTVLATIGGAAGGVDWRTAAAGFALASNTHVDVTLEADSALAAAYIRGLSLNQV